MLDSSSANLAITLFWHLMCLPLYHIPFEFQLQPMKRHRKWTLHRHPAIYHRVQVQVIHHHLVQVIPALQVTVTVKQVRTRINAKKKQKT